MSRLGTIGRRSFLVGSALIMGGIAFGTYAVRRPEDNPLEAGLAHNEATFNPWVHISDEKITLIVPHADKGQGVASAQAALIAEELDLDMGQFEISFGVPSRAYWNRAMQDESAPFMSTDDGFLAETTRANIKNLVKLLGAQGTGGSTSMPDSYDKLRRAGAAARETLKLAAAQKFNESVDRLRTKSGAVILPDGTSVAYTDLVDVARDIDPVQLVTLRDPKDWRLIGKPMQRLDIVAKSTGTLEYGIDAEIEGMVYATVVCNPRKGGEMRGYDASTAEKMRGVKAVVPITGGVGVVADNTWRAFKASQEIVFDWGPAPYPPEQDDHWKAVANSFTPDHLDGEWRNEGDIENAQGQDVVAEYKSPYVAHAPLEPLNAIVKVTDDRVDIWTGHQVPIILTQLIARVTGHDQDQVHFHNFYIGGSFGHRLEFEWVKQTAEIAMAMKGTPVKMTYSREEDFTHDFPRHIAMGRGSGKVANGKVVAMDLQIAAPSVLESQMGRAGLSVPGPDAQIVAGGWNNPYSLDHLRVRGYRVAGLAPTSSWRAVGANGAGFIFDSFLDELIAAAGADPLLERIRLMDHNHSTKVLETVGEMSNWGEALPDGTGKGVSFVESFGVQVALVVQVAQTDGGLRIEKVWGAADVGRVIDPVNFENLFQGGIVFGLGHAMNCEITYSDGIAQQPNYHAHEGMRMYQCPEITVKALELQHNVRGFGEPMVPATAPALANAVYAATGVRVRELPLWNHVDFV